MSPILHQGNHDSRTRGVHLISLHIRVDYQQIAGLRFAQYIHKDNLDDVYVGEGLLNGIKSSKVDYGDIMSTFSL